MYITSLLGHCGLQSIYLLTVAMDYSCVHIFAQNPMHLLRIPFLPHSLKMHHLIRGKETVFQELGRDLVLSWRAVLCHSCQLIHLNKLSATWTHWCSFIVGNGSWESLVLLKKTNDLGFGTHWPICPPRGHKRLCREYWWFQVQRLNSG